MASNNHCHNSLPARLWLSNSKNYPNWQELVFLLLSMMITKLNKVLDTCTFESCSSKMYFQQHCHYRGKNLQSSDNAETSGLQNVNIDWNVNKVLEIIESLSDNFTHNFNSFLLIKSAKSLFYGEIRIWILLTSSVKQLFEQNYESYS